MKGSCTYGIIVFLTFTAFTGGISKLSAQGKSKIQGVVYIDKQHPVIDCQILLRSILDSSTYKVTSSDSLGHYVFTDVAFAEYQLIFSYFSCSQSQSLVVSAVDVRVPPVSLDSCVKQLSAVTITKRASVIEHKIDHLQFNIKNSILADNSNVWQALKLIPNVRTGLSGSVQVGDKNAAIYIDDVPLQLTQSDLATFLQSYNTTNIERIDIYEQPPARFEASQGSVINIISKKQRQNGIAGSVFSSYQQSTYAKFNNGINFNGKKDKIDFDLNANITNGRYLSTDKDYIEYNTTNQISDWNIENSSVENRHTFNIRAAAKYAFAKKTSAGIQFTHAYVHSKAPGLIQTDIMSLNKLDSMIFTKNQLDYDSKMTIGNLYLKTVLDTIGGYVQFSTNLLEYVNSPFQTVRSSTVNVDSSLLSNYFNNTSGTQKIRVRSVLADLTKQVHNFSIEAGAKAYFVKTRSDYHFESSANQQQNEFNYSEQNYALYLTVAKKWKNLAAKAGLRVESTFLDIESKTNLQDSSGSQRYSKLFPSLHLQYTIDANSQLFFSGARRISRPDYYRLNPFAYYTTPYSYTSGNPYLKPSFDYSVQGDFVLKNNYTFSVFHNFSRDKFTNITEQDNETNVFKDQQLNIGKSNSSGVSFYCDIFANKIWQISHYLRLSYKTEKSNYLNNDYSFHKFICYYSLDNSFKLSKDESLSAEIHFFYLSPTIQGIYKNGKMYDLSFGFRKRIKQFTFNIDINDLLYSNFNKIDVNYLDQRNGFIYRTDSRSIVFGARYSFSNNSKRRQLELDLRNDNEEIKRVNSSK